MSFISNSTPLLRQLNFLVRMQYKRSIKFLNLATFRLKNTGRKDDFKIVAIVAKLKFDFEPYDSFVE